jgi:hypothetical protein
VLGLGKTDIGGTALKGGLVRSTDLDLKLANGSFPQIAAVVASVCETQG